MTAVAQDRRMGLPLEEEEEGLVSFLVFDLRALGRDDFFFQDVCKEMSPLIAIIFDLYYIHQEHNSGEAHRSWYYRYSYIIFVQDVSNFIDVMS